MYLYESKHCAKCYKKIKYDRSTKKGKGMVYIFKCPKCQREYLTDFDWYSEIQYGSDDDD